MYEQHFGLKKRPFRANATGTDVFVGPQTATILAGLKKALTNSDAIVTVSGPVGCGKTTLVNRALETIGAHSIVVRLARIRLESTDVLEYLLDELGVEDRPNGIIQKLALFRRRLEELQSQNTRVFIAVEDISHLGAETLAELEALTAADAGVSEGAGIVLMGDENLDKMVLAGPLVRVKQRIRQRFTVAPLCAAELRGYLRHCFRLAGGDFERLFEFNAAPLVHHLGGGVMRTTNSLIDSALATAHDRDLPKVTSELLARVAENEYGLSAAGFDLAAQPAALPVLTAEPEPKSESEPVLAPEPIPAAEPVAIAVPVTPSTPVVEAPAAVVAKAPERAAEDKPEESLAEVEIPEFIQDTLPDLEILGPALVKVDPAPAPAPAPKAEPVIEPKIAAESDGDDVPAWDRDPTVAELRPDIEALEAALAFGRSDDPEPAAVNPAPLPKPQPKIPELIPEITLDHAISQRIANNLIDEPGEISAPKPEKGAKPAMNSSRPAYSAAAKPPKKADSELEKIAAELAKAKSIEDVDDRMAETLFGDELNFVAAQFVANRPREESANDDSDETPDVEVTLEATRKLDDSGMDLSASQRLKTVRALNADPQTVRREPKPAAEVPPELPVVKPESIEDQINTSMTQTLKALNVRPPVNDDDLDDDESKRGFFSRFKRS